MRTIHVKIACTVEAYAQVTLQVPDATERDGIRKLVLEAFKEAPDLDFEPEFGSVEDYRITSVEDHDSGAVFSANDMTALNEEGQAALDTGNP